MQVLGRLGEDHFESGTNVRFEKMATPGTPVCFAEHDMRMHLGLALGQRDVADERENFDLFLDWNPLVLTLGDTEITEGYIAEGANSRELACAEVMFARESFQTLGDLIAGFENHRPGLLSI